MEKSIIIIGAGIAGLSTGCYCQMNGYNTQIFEMHTTPGGLCTTWKRKGYKINGAIHWLNNTRAEDNLYHFYEEVGAIQGRSIFNYEEIARIEGEEGKVLIAYADLDRLEQHMKQLAPEDRNTIEDFIKAARRMIHFSIFTDKAPELYSPIDGLKIMFKLLPYLMFWRKWGNVSMQEFAQRFKNPFLRRAFPLIMSDLHDFPMAALSAIFAQFHTKTAGYPLGGSLEFASAIEKRYRNLGGELYYKSPVVRIIVENDRAVGVQLADGSEYRSDIVISAADGRATIFDMLDGKYINEKIQGYYNKLPILPPQIYIALGVDRSFDELTSQMNGVSYYLEEPIIIAGRELMQLPVRIYNFDSSLAPIGKTLLTISLDSDYDYWKKLIEEPERYKAEKEQIAEQVVTQLDRRFAGLRSQVEMCDVATPMTYERYTGNWRGSYQGWQITTKSQNISISRTLPGLENFYMVGQWAQVGGGVMTGILHGSYVTQIICKKDKKKFVTSTP